MSMLQLLFADSFNNSAKRKVKSAWRQVRAGKQAKAEAILYEVIKHHPHHPDALQLLGDMAFDNANYVDAVKFYSGVTQAQPNLFTAHCNLAYALRKLKKFT